MTVSPNGPMLDLLSADGPDPTHAEAMMLYGRLVGQWSVRNRYQDSGGQWKTASGQWRFGWVLGGRAVQDVLFCPKFHDRYPGTTVRCYNIGTGLWHIAWMSPYSGSYVIQTGRSDGEGGMIQEGTTLEGTRSRWIFTEVTPVSFRWRGYSADADGGEFELVQEMHATRG